MFDAGIISLPASWPYSRSPVSSERTSTPQTPRDAIGAPKTCPRSVSSWRTAFEAARRGARGRRWGGRGAVRAARAGHEERDQQGRAATHAGGDYLISSSALTIAVERRRVDLRGAGLAAATAKTSLPVRT